MLLLLGICFSLSNENLDFSLVSTTGKTYRLSELKGRLVYLNFFSEHCYPCEREVPLLNQINKLEPDLLLVLGIGYNYSSLEQLKRSQQKMKMEFPVLFDPQNQLARKLGVIGLPYALLIDEQGRIKIRFLGEQSKELLEVINQELARRRKELAGKEIYLEKFEPLNALPKGFMVNLRAQFRDCLFQKGYWATSVKERATYGLEVHLGKWLDIVEFDFQVCARKKKGCCYQGKVQTLGIDLERYFLELEKAIGIIAQKKACKDF